MDRNSKSTLKRGGYAVALRKESVDRNQYLSGVMEFGPGSLSARRAWIEIKAPKSWRSFGPVALRKESVDRNPVCVNAACIACLVALRKESVDRNGEIKLNANLFVRSLSARRAWIEIATPVVTSTAGVVALRKESVDREILNRSSNFWIYASLSARRAWIEMPTL